VIQIYKNLIALTDSIGAQIALAATLIRTGHLTDANKVIESLDHDQVKDHQPYWVLKAEFCLVKKEYDLARNYFEVATGLSEDPAVRDYLATKMK